MPDEQHVERVRRSVAIFDRYRGFLVGFHVFLLVLWLVMAVAMTILMQRLSGFFGAGNHWGPAGFLIGTTVGFSVSVIDASFHSTQICWTASDSDFEEADAGGSRAAL